MDCGSVRSLFPLRELTPVGRPNLFGVIHSVIVGPSLPTRLENFFPCLFGPPQFVGINSYFQRLVTSSGSAIGRRRLSGLGLPALPRKFGKVFVHVTFEMNLGAVVLRVDSRERCQNLFGQAIGNAVLSPDFGSRHEAVQVNQHRGGTLAVVVLDHCLSVGPVPTSLAVARFVHDALLKNKAMRIGHRIDGPPNSGRSTPY